MTEIRFADFHKMLTLFILNIEKFISLPETFPHMSHSQLSVTLVESNPSVYETSKASNVSYFNFREINHQAHGKLIYVYPGGTIGGGHIGIVPKTMAKKVGLNPEVIDYRLENGAVVMDLVVPKIKEEPSNLRGCLGLLMICLVLGFAFHSCFNGELTPEEKIEQQFSTIDGRHFMLQIFVEDHLNDPESFNHIKTVHSVEEDHILVLMKYSAKNALNGMVQKEVTAKVDKEDGHVIEIVSEE